MAVINANPKNTDPDSKRYRIQLSAAEGEALDNVIIHENNTKMIQEAINRAIATALEEIGLAAERFAKRETPVDTGRLRDSITHTIGIQDAYIGTNVEYAPYVENGTHSRTGKKMLYRAATEHGDFYRNIMKKHLENG